MMYCGFFEQKLREACEGHAKHGALARKRSEPRSTPT